MVSILWWNGRLPDCIKKEDPIIFCLQMTLTGKANIGLEWKIFQANEASKQAGVAISDKEDWIWCSLPIIPATQGSRNWGGSQFEANQNKKVSEKPFSTNKLGMVVCAYDPS
jgi:hypothetical protein